MQTLSLLFSPRRRYKQTPGYSRAFVFSVFCISFSHPTDRAQIHFRIASRSTSSAKSTSSAAMHIGGFTRSTLP